MAGWNPTGSAAAMDTPVSRTITISVAGNRKERKWKARSVTLEEFYEILEKPVIGVENMETYLHLPKAEQDELKDRGGFVGGALRDGRRKAGYVEGRDLITLDFDTIPAYGTQEVIDRAEALGCGFAVYSTRKHRPEAPRLRLIFPTDRTVTADEYEPIARRLAEQIGIKMADPTTFEPWRLMYWPSVCAGAEYILKTEMKPLVSADQVLTSYADWRDHTQWPVVPGVDPRVRLAAKQGDPDSKPGIVGAFNRACGGVVEAMEKYLPGVYEPCDAGENRWTYTGGSTAGGAVVYEGGKFLYSHHSTDPCCGRLVNAFDLVRLHKFGDLDNGENVKPGTPVNKLPSFLAMGRLIADDPEVSALLLREHQERMLEDAKGLSQDAENEKLTQHVDTEWINDAKLAMNAEKTGAVLPTQENILRIFRHDPALNGLIAMDSFAGYITARGPLPWNADPQTRRWTDTDLNGLYWYMESAFQIVKRTHIDTALDIYAAENAFHPLQDYLNSLEWDGTARLDRLFVTYLGAEDTEYTRMVTRKILVGAVARAMKPGIKFDTMLVLCGTQGHGKSSILNRLSKGWFNDTILTFEGKEAAELIQGAWLVEIPELNAMKKSDINRVKQFLSLQADRYRPAYGRNVREAPRSCVFFGTVNEMEFLEDLTGNRRFWPLDIDVVPKEKDHWKALTDEEIDQVWAEALVRWRIGERLYLTAAEESMVLEVQEAHRNASPEEGMIAAFINRPVPEGWRQWTIRERKDFWRDNLEAGRKDNLTLVPRDAICAKEIMMELETLDSRLNAKQVKQILRRVLKEQGGWMEKRIRFGPDYGIQKGFARV